MSNETRQLISDYLGHITARDIDAAGEYFAEDFVGHALGESKLAGDHDKAVMLQTLRDYLTERELTVKPVDVLTSDMFAAAVVHNTIEHADGTYEGMRVVLYKVEDGKIRELWVFDENQRAFDAAVDNP